MTEDQTVSVTAEISGAIASVKLQSSQWELNIHGSLHEFAQLARIDETDWATRRVLRVGVCAGSPTFWCAEASVVMLLIGADDEAWDIAMVIQRPTIDEIVTAVAAADTPMDAISGH